MPAVKSAGPTGANLRGTVVTNAATMAMNVAASVICARMLGPLGRGSFSVIQLWPITAAGLGTLGLPRAVTYYLGKGRHEEKAVIATGIFVLLSAAAGGAVLLYALMPYLTASQPVVVRNYARWCLALLPVLFLGSLPYYVLQGLNQMHDWNVLRLQLPVLWIGMHLAGYFLNRTDLAFYVWGYALVMSAHNLTWIAVFALQFPIRGRADWQIARGLLRYGTPLAMGSTPQFLNLRLDQVLMAAFVSPRVLGLYVTAVAWSGLLLPLLTALSQVLYPMVLAQSDSARQYELIGRSLRLSTWCSAACAGALITCTPLAIPRIFGPAFRDAVWPACILAIASVFLAMNNILSEGLRALGLTKYPMYAEFAGFAATGTLLVALLPRWPLIGASIASLVSYALTTLVLVWSAARTGTVSASTLLAPRRGDVRDLRRIVRQCVPLAL